MKEDYALNLRIQPTKILLNQAILKFCLNFFEGIIPTPTEGASKKKPRRSSIGGPKKEILVSQIVIHPSYLILSYTSRNLNLMDLTSGNLLEFLNIIDISGLRLSIQSYHLKQSLPIEAAIKHLLRFYIDDLVGN